MMRTKRLLRLLLALLLGNPVSVTYAADFTLSSPLDYQVVQRKTKDGGSLVSQAPRSCRCQAQQT